MKNFKKIMYIVLALLPVVALLLCLFNEHVDLMPLGSVTVANNVVSVEPDTWAAYLLTPLGFVGDFNDVPGLFGAAVRLVDFLQVHAGLVPSMPFIMVVWYAIYMFVIEFLMLMFDLLLFVPRKCREVIER